MTEVAQAGAIPFTVADGRPKILLVRAKRSPKEWIFPKGHVEPGEDAESAAVRELREEGGVDGKSLQFAGTLRFRSGDEDVAVQYFLVRFRGTPSGGEERERGLFDLDEAQQLLVHEDARRLLRACRTVILADAGVMDR